MFVHGKHSILKNHHLKGNHLTESEDIQLLSKAPLYGLRFSYTSPKKLFFFSFMVCFLTIKELYDSVTGNYAWTNT